LFQKNIGWKMSFHLFISISFYLFITILCAKMSSVNMALRKQKLSKYLGFLSFPILRHMNLKSKVFWANFKYYLGSSINDVTQFLILLDTPSPIVTHTSDALRPWRHIWITTSFFFMGQISLWDRKFAT
jgi:hypothetical protein